MKKLAIITFISISSPALFGQTPDTLKIRFFERAAWDAHKNYYFRKCIRLLDSAFYFGSKSEFCYSIKAEAHWFVGEYAEAAKTYKKEISISDSSRILRVSAFVFLGMLYDKDGMHKYAREQYTSAIRLWESGYVALKQFRDIEELEYLFAFGLMGDKKIWKKKLGTITKKGDHDSYPELIRKRHLYENHSKLFTLTRIELLNMHFEPFMLSKNQKPLEE